MTEFHSSSSLALWLLLLLFGELVSHATTGHVILTSGDSEKELFLPDEQVVRLLFWVNGTGRKALEGNDDEEETVKEDKEEADDETVQYLIDQNISVFPEDNTITITYFVFNSQYPTLTFPVPERDVWLSVIFRHDRVYIPEARVSRSLLTPSWWGRMVKVSSGPPVYWHLCLSSYDCAPGDPLHPLQNTNTSMTSDSGSRLERSLVIVLGTTSGVLLLLCLILVALVHHLWQRRRLRRGPSRTVHPLPHANRLPAHHYSTHF